ncbi:MAG: hypothetical protein HY269_01060 [Deltaproteobacteria bacterium]|nr:hypothetical protein [Deltaproteobacteria bacterium]
MLEGGDDTAWKVYFVDLEDFRRLPTVSEERRMLNLVHLDRTIGRFLPRTQRLRFIYNYLGSRPVRTEARRLVSRFLAIRERAEQRARSHHRSSVAVAPEAREDAATVAPL